MEGNEAEFFHVSWIDSPISFLSLSCAMPLVGFYATVIRGCQIGSMQDKSIEFWHRTQKDIGNTWQPGDHDTGKKIMERSLFIST